MCGAMKLDEVAHRARRGERTLLRWQRRLWLAQIAAYPLAILSAVVLAVVGWLAWQRKSHQPGAVAGRAEPGPPVTNGQAPVVAQP
jgi:hypothetical protein